jgi:lysyl endopeptidase
MDQSVIKRFWRFRFKFLCGLVFLTVMAHGQLTRPGSPLPLHYPGLKDPEIFEIEISEPEKRVLGKPTESLLKPARSGILLEVNFNLGNSGTWDTLADRTLIWRCGFHISGARLLSLVFKPFQLKSGVRIYLYDPLQQNILGAFSDLNNKATRVLATGQVTGDILIMELQVPRFVGYPGDLTIAGIGCDFAQNSDMKPDKDGWFGLSGNCNVDINCLKEPAYQQVKNAVVRIVYQGGERCTGTLLNNTHQDGRNYLLTAEHCIHSEDNANSAVFYFSYESPYCGGPDGSSAKSVSGATLRATSSNLDFSLLELLEPIPMNYHPYYAGWDITSDPPPSAFSIHHPQGDVKKISTEKDPLTISSFGSNYDPNKHWLVSHWETGTTEVGSSGGGLFDPENRLRGSLTGGQASCENSVNDYFQMISHDWNDFPSPENQLAYWLDPLEIKSSRLDGFDPYAGFWESGDTLSNIRLGEEIKLEESNLAWGAWSGHNSASIRQFAEHFSDNKKDKILGLILQVAHNDVVHSSSNLLVKVWQDQELPGKVIYQKEVLLADLTANIDNFVEFDSIVTVADSFFAGYEIFYNDPLDTFSTYMAGNRLNDPLNTAYVYDYQWQSLDHYTGGLLHSSFAVMPLVFDSISQTSPGTEFSGDLILYPNPASTYCWLEFREVLASSVQLSIYNMQGEMVATMEFGPYQRTIRLETENLKNGVYLIGVKRDNRLNRVKMIIVR